MSRLRRIVRWLVVVASVPFGQAQIEAALPAVPVAATCIVVDVAPDQAPPGGAGMLLASCGQPGTVLGPAAAYSTANNAASGSVLLVRKHGGRTSVLLIAPLAGKIGVHVDDITLDLAVLCGRAGDLGLSGCKVDASRFAVDGSVGVAKEGIVKRLDLTDYLGRAAAITAPLTQAPSIANAAGD